MAFDLDTFAVQGEVPDYLAGLPVGRHDIRLGTIGYRVVSVERGGARYCLLHDIALHARREQRLAWMLGLMVMTMTMLSALGGIWLSRTVVAPVTELAAKVRHRSPNDWEHPLAGLVKILVRNLVRNAFAYTAAGSVVLRQDAASLTVSDTGRGIPGHAIEQVFVRHYRDLSSEGAGIGLSLVKRICDRYGWRLRLESKEDQGTVVTVGFS